MKEVSLITNLLETDGYMKLYSTEVYCPWLPAPVNGTKSTNETVFGTMVQFACLEGLGVVGSLSLVCESSGTWSGFVPVCTCNQI